MSEVTKAIKERRTIRKFEKKDLDENMLQSILEAARWSQSWANTQCWEIIVVKDPKNKKALQQTMAKGNPATNSVVEAPIVLAICAKLQLSGYYKGQAPTKFKDWFMFDLGILSQNICLEANALGLGSVVIGLFDHEKGKEALNIPDGYELVVLIPFGYPAETPKIPTRKEINEFVHYDTF